jgi:surface carbohydrate biosynthesis protein
MIYGSSGSEVILNYLSEGAEVFKHPEYEINAWVALAALVRGRITREGYLLTYLKWVKPRTVITLEDNDPLFYRIQPLMPSCKTVAIQNGRRDNIASSPIGGFFDELRRQGEHHELNASVIATFGPAVASLYSECFKHQSPIITPIGSIRNNSIPEHNSQSKPRVVYISSMPNFAVGGDPESDKTLAYYHGSPVTYRQNWLAERIAVLQAARFSEKNHLPFVVLGKRTAKHEGEHRYFSQIIGNHQWEFFPCQNQATSYERIHSKDIIVAVDGTLGYEMFGRGYRVAFLSGRLRLAGLGQHKDCNFGFPIPLPDRGPFWTNDLSEAETQRILQFVATSSQIEWERETRALREQLMVYNPLNTMLCDLLHALGVSTTGPQNWRAEFIPEN